MLNALTAHDGPGVVLLTGFSGVDALELVLAWRRMQRAQGRDPFVVVPSRGEALDLTRRLAEEEGVILGGPAVGTVDDVVTACLESQVQWVPPLVREAFVYEAGLPLWGREGSVLGRLQRPLPALVDLMEEFEESGLDDHQIQDALAAWAAGTRWETARTLAGELSLIVSGYGRLCRETGVESRSRRVRLAALQYGGGGGHVARPVGVGLGDSGDIDGRQWNRPLACCGFLTFTPAQQRFLQAVARSVPVVVESGWDGSYATEFMGAEVGRWLDGGAVHVPRSQAEVAGEGSATAGVEYRLLKSSGRRGELETAVAEVVQLMREGLSPSRVMFVARRVGPWRRMALGVCARYGVPLALDAPMRLGETRLGHALLRGLREELTGKRAAMPEEIDLHACVSGTGSGSRLVPGAVSEATRQLRRLWVTGAPESVQVEAWDVRAAEAVCGAMQAMGDWGLLMGAHELGEPGRQGAVSGLSAGALLDFLAETRLRAAGDPVDALSLVSATRMRLRRPEVVFVLGLVDQEFPEAEGARGLLSARLRRDCNRCAGVRLVDEAVEGQDAFLFHTAVSAASRMVYLSQRMADDDGGPLSASPFLEEKLEAFPELTPWRTRTLADVVWEPSLAPSPREFARSCAASGILPQGVDPVSWLRVREGAGRLEISLRDSENVAWLAAKNSFSAGEIETYARCPVLWFLEKMVGVEIPGEPGDSLELGSLVHSVLAALYPALGSLKLLPLSPNTVKEAEDVAEEILAREASEEGTDEGRAALLSAHACYLVRDHLRREAGQGAEYATVLTEYALPAAGVDLGEGVIVRGRIDRLDLDAEQGLCAVVDYKTGKFVPQRDWAASGSLQVPLYMLALQQLHPQREIVAGGYLVLGAGKASGFVTEAGQTLVGVRSPWRSIDCEGRDLLLEDCRHAAAAAVEGMRGGRYGLPPGVVCPRYCQMGPICRMRRGDGRG